MVRLVVSILSKLALASSSFNSSVVRLVGPFKVFERIPHSFQFQCGAIGSLQPRVWFLENPVFQFQCGAIGSCNKV